MFPRKISLLLSLLIFPIFILGVSQCASIPMDPNASAASGADKTIVFQGGGAVSQKGYLFFQKQEGTLPTDLISLIVPQVDCKRDSCVRFQFFRKDGSTGFAGGIAKGVTKFDFHLSDLVGRTDAVAVTDEGEYDGVVQIFFTGNDGQEYSTLFNGFVRLNVLTKGYSPVGCADPNIAWTTKVSDNCDAQFTTVGRSVSCGSGCL